MIQIQIPEKAKYIIETIQNAGFEAYVVGGCVRDSILGRPPEDWDITTSARPEQVKQLFRRTIDIGIQSWHRNRHAGQGKALRLRPTVWMENTRTADIPKK
ncbi:MAG: hypothetical protein ACLTG0_10725 [Oscillibacter sp.]